MKIKLIRLKESRTSNVLDFPIIESLGLSYISSSLRNAGYDSEIIDEEVEGLKRNETIKKIKNTDLIGFTAIAKSQIYDIIDTVKELRTNYKGHITVGGQFASFLYKELLELPNIFDSVVLYEGEETTINLVENLERGNSLENIEGLAYKENNQIKRNKLRRLIDNLDDLPFPSRDLTKKIISIGGLNVISSSRGCYNRCAYCSISQFYGDPPGKRFRLRSSENVIKELENIKKNFPEIKDIWFVDDNFVSKNNNMERTKDICNKLKELDIIFDIYLRADDADEKLLKLLKDSGIKSIFIGAESGCDNTLKNIYNKKLTAEETKESISLCKKFDILVDPGFIMFHPWSTMEEIGENIKFLEEIGSYTPYGILSFLTAYKFTPIGKKMLSGEMPYKSPRTKLDELLVDDVPYEIQEEKTELLLDMSLIAFKNFNELPKALTNLRAKARKDNDKFLSHAYLKGHKEYSKLSMHYFKELYNYLNKDGRYLNEFLESISKEIKTETGARVKNIEKLISS